VTVIAVRCKTSDVLRCSTYPNYNDMVLGYNSGKLTQSQAAYSLSVHPITYQEMLSAVPRVSW